MIGPDDEATPAIRPAVGFMGERGPDLVARRSGRPAVGADPSPRDGEVAGPWADPLPTPPTRITPARTIALQDVTSRPRRPRSLFIIHPPVGIARMVAHDPASIPSDPRDGEAPPQAVLHSARARIVFEIHHPATSDAR